MLSKYRHLLGYVGAITKIFGKVQKQVPHFGRRELYSEWGRSPGGEEGVCHSHVIGRQLVLCVSTTFPLDEIFRDEKPIRSVPEHDEQLIRSAPSAGVLARDCWRRADLKTTRHAKAVAYDKRRA